MRLKRLEVNEKGVRNLQGSLLLYIENNNGDINPGKFLFLFLYKLYSRFRPKF